MIVIRKGINNKPLASESLINVIKTLDMEGRLYIGYPVIAVGEFNKTFDALLILKDKGIVIIELEEGSTFESSIENQDILYGVLDSYLRGYQKLRKNRKDLEVPLEVITFAPRCKNPNSLDGSQIATNNDEFIKFINDLENWKLKEGLFSLTLSVIQSVISLISGKDRSYVKSANSLGARLRNLEKTIANLDNDQESAVIDYFEGVQRIRGLAGSGKTIVLALKAAYLHSQNSDWKIAVVFNTRSLKFQFKSLIKRFFAEKKKTLPNFDNIQVINAWGSTKDKEYQRGLYYQFCLDHNLEFLNYTQAKNQVGSKDAFGHVCKKALENMQTSITKFDAILIDEAQDLNAEFLKLAFSYLKDPKRLIYAYDELQKLNEGQSLPSPQEIFNRNAKDTILRKCYRNSRPLLTTAHSLGFGIYKKGKDNISEMVQFFDQPELWSDVGYKVIEGNLLPNNQVKLGRTNDTSPEYLEHHTEIDELIQFIKFDDKNEQAVWIANSIEKNLNEDELLYNDIIVINPFGLSTKKEVGMVREILNGKRIKSHIAGDWDPNVFFEDNSITFTGINRAKGNEVAMVYIISSQECYSSSIFKYRELISRRNSLFTAITRSKAWVRVCGTGIRMAKLIEEYDQTKGNEFNLSFQYPTHEEISNMNLIHRDLQENEKNKIKEEVQLIDQIPAIIERIKKEQTLLEDYPEDIQKILRLLIDGK